jgi:thiol-disulfide isomerase/thioredoxin
MIADGPPANRPPHIELAPIVLEPLLLSSPSLKFAILGCALLIAGCDRQSADKAQPQTTASENAASAVGGIDRSHAGSALPDFQLKDQAGNELNFASLKGRPALINLWATWCAPCIAELPQLDAIAARAGGPKVLTIDQDTEKLDLVAKFLKARGVNRLEPWLNPDNSVMFHYEAEMLPTTVLYDSAGTEVWRTSGPRDWASADSAALIAEAK